MSHQTYSLSTLLLLSKALALPAPEANMMPSLDTIKSLISRDIPQGVPSCSVDPSYSTATSQWANRDGEGYYAGSDCNVGKNNGHCWTDYYLISTSHFYDSWTLTDSIDCGRTSTCDNMRSSAIQICTKAGSEASDTINTGITLGLGEIASWLAPVDPKVDLSNQVSVSVSREKQKCDTSTNQGTCTWTDQKCHSIWQAAMKSRVFGYIRRRCNSARDGTNIPREQQDAAHAKGQDQYYTVGMQDFSFDQPSDTTLMGCSALCNETTYPDPAPGLSPMQFPWSN